MSIYNQYYIYISLNHGEHDDYDNDEEKLMLDYVYNTYLSNIELAETILP